MRRQRRRQIEEKILVDAQYTPSEEERAELGQVLGMPGFEVIERIANSVVAKAKQLLQAANPLDEHYEKTVVELHRRSQVAEGVWEEIRRQIERERTLLKQPRKAKVMPDVTEELNTTFEEVERELGLTKG